LDFSRLTRIDSRLSATLLTSFVWWLFSVKSHAKILKPRGIRSISEHLPDPDFTPFGKLAVLVRRRGFELDRRAGPSWTYTATFKKLTAAR
jgi:hypothetical protein